VRHLTYYLIRPAHPSAADCFSAAAPLPSARFHDVALIRQLARLGAPEGPASSRPLAAQLGDWLSVADAIRLYEVLHGRDVAASAATSGCDLTPEIDALQSVLTRHFAEESVPNQARVRLPGGSTAIDLLTDFAPYQRYYLAQQREMAQQIGALRARLRAASGNRALAKLDAEIESLLGGSAERVLARVTQMLARRFEQLRAAQNLADADPTTWLAPGGWLQQFRHEIRTALGGELDLRLAPLRGLTVPHPGHCIPPTTNGSPYGTPTSQSLSEPAVVS
jgi:hypothetical protein